MQTKFTPPPSNFSFKKYYLLILFLFLFFQPLSMFAQSLGPQPMAQHSAGLNADGTVYNWGYNWWGQLGDNTNTDRHTPVKVLKGAYSEGTTYLGDNGSNPIIEVAPGYIH